MPSIVTLASSTGDLGTPPSEILIWWITPLLLRPCITSRSASSLPAQDGSQIIVYLPLRYNPHSVWRNGAKHCREGIHLMGQGALPAEVLAEAREALAAWKLKDGAWRLVGTVPGSRGVVLRPVVEIGDTRYVLR